MNCLRTCSFCFTNCTLWSDLIWDLESVWRTCLLACIGCMALSGLSTRSLCWCTKFYMGLRHDTWDLSHGSWISLVNEHCTLPALVACWYHPSGSQQSAAGSSQLLVPMSGTPCRRDDISTITGDFLTMSENLTFQAVLPWTSHLLQHNSDCILTV